MNRSVLLVVAAVVGCFGPATGASAQQPRSAPPPPRGSVSFYATTTQTQTDGGFDTNQTLFTTAFTYRMPERTEDGLDYGIDMRQSASTTPDRPQRMSVYEAFVGARFGGGTRQIRGGNMWLNDLGALGSVAGGLFEIRQSPEAASRIGHVRVGVFGGLEPNVYAAGYAPDVVKYGTYVALDGKGARRQVVGFVTVRDASVRERSVLTFTNFLPLNGNRFFLYQAAEYDVKAPAGQGQPGLSYFFNNVRYLASPRLELQGTYSRGRAIDARGLSQDVLNGRPITASQAEGFLYNSVGGRVTVEVARRVRVFAGYSRDRNNRDDRPTGRMSFGAYAGNLLKSGFDLSANEWIMNRPAGRYHSLFLSVGRQLGRRVYLSGDYTNSLSILQFSRSDGIVVRLQPHTHRFSGTGIISLGGSMSVLTTVERTLDDQAKEVRVLSGLTYRF
jgi:hypothetical protein